MEPNAPPRKTTAPSEHVVVPSSDERTDRMWRRLERELAPPSQRSRAGTLAFAAACALAALVGLSLLRDRAAVSPAKPLPSAIARDEARVVDPLVTLVDGTRLRPTGDARTTMLVASESEVRVRLEAGAIDLEVSADPRRIFVLETGRAVLLADDARFRAELAGEPATLSIVVQSGAVRVVAADGQALASLAAGQAWSLHAPAIPPLEAAVVRRPELVPPRPPSTAGTPSAIVSSLPASPSETTARDLFASASQARLAGQPAAAARDLERLCSTFPHDSRAGLAAHQLARLLLRELGRPAEAARYFRVALAHPNASTYREDAAADLVEALDRTKQKAECLAARRSFEAAFPTSIRLASVARLCADE